MLAELQSASTLLPGALRSRYQKSVAGDFHIIVVEQFDKARPGLCVHIKSRNTVGTVDIFSLPTMLSSSHPGQRLH